MSIKITQTAQISSSVTEFLGPSFKSENSLFRPVKHNQPADAKRSV